MGTSSGVSILTSSSLFSLEQAQDFKLPSKSIKQGQATASPAEGEKNTTKDAETNLQNELVELFCIDVVEQYHNMKLLFDKYCNKMLKRRKSSKIINCNVIIQKGPISLKVYREDETIEVIANSKSATYIWLNGERLYKFILIEMKRMENHLWIDKDNNRIP
ncbi:hypothetical protein Tco_0375686 [Tanacetum coccineum]